MFPNQMQRVMEFFITKYPRMPILEVGHSGIAKTQLAKDAAKALGIPYVRLNATGMEPTDLTGLPKLVDNLTHWLPPAIMKPLESAKSSLLLMDEINRVPPETRHVLMQALDEREIGELKLGDGCQIILTANPDDPGYQVDDLDRAFMRRCCVLPLEFSFEAFRDWAMTQYVSPTGRPISAKALSAMGRNKQAFVKEIKNMAKFRQEPSPDGVVRCSELEQAGLYEEFTHEEVIQIFSGIVGNEVAISLAKDLNDEELKRLKAKLDMGEEINARHDLQIDLMYYVWQDYGSEPAKNAKKIHHLFKQLNGDIKLILVKMCAKFFKKKETKDAFAPMRKDWKSVMSEQMMNVKGIDENEVRDLLNQLGQ